MIHPPSAARRAFSLPRWIGKVFLGWLLGIVLILLLSGAFDAIGLREQQAYLGLGLGLGVGLLQWLELRKYYPIPAQWIGYSALGLGLPFLVFDFLPPALTVHRISISVVAGAALTGLLQRPLLARFGAPAWRWVAANTVGWPLAAATAFLVDYTRPLTTHNLLLALINLLLLLSGGAVLGLISGLALHRILTNSLLELASN